MRKSYLTFGAMLFAVIAFGCDSGPTGAGVPATAPTDNNPAAAPAIEAEPIAPNESATVSEEDPRYVSFPAVGVKLIRPDGFDDAEGFHGFMQRSTSGSVVAIKMPAPYAEVTMGFTPEILGTRGISLISKEPLTIEGKTGILLDVRQSAQGIEFAKWIVMFGNETETTMVSGIFPAADETGLSERLKAVVLAIKLDNSPAPPPGADLPFTIVPSGDLKAGPPISKTLLYALDGAVPAKSPADPIFIAAPSFSEVVIEDRRQYAVNRLYQIGNTKVNAITSNEPVSIDGLDGFEIVATGEDDKSRTPLCVYQVMLFDGESYILLVGMVGADRTDEYLPQFKAMARSLTRKAP